MTPDNNIENKNNSRPPRINWDAMKKSDDGDLFENDVSFHGFVLSKSGFDEIEEINPELLSILKEVYSDLRGVLGIEELGEEFHIGFSEGMEDEDSGRVTKFSEKEVFLILPSRLLGDWFQGVVNSVMYRVVSDGICSQFYAGSDLNEKDQRSLAGAVLKATIAHELFHVRQFYYQKDIVDKTFKSNFLVSLLSGTQETHSQDKFVQYWMNQGEVGARVFAIKYLDKLSSRYGDLVEVEVEGDNDQTLSKFAMTQDLRDILLGYEINYRLHFSSIIESSGSTRERVYIETLRNILRSEIATLNTQILASVQDSRKYTDWREAIESGEVLGYHTVANLKAVYRILDEDERRIFKQIFMNTVSSNKELLWGLLFARIESGVE